MSSALFVSRLALWRRPLIARLAVAIVSLLPPVTASSQSPGALSVLPGARVRVTTVDSLPSVATRRATGVLHAMTADSMSIVWDHGLQSTLATAKVARLEVSSGRGSYARRGLVVGLLTGVTAGALINALAYEQDIYGNRGNDMVVGAIYLSLPGALIGAVVGAAIRTERWTLIRDLRSPTVGFAPILDGRSFGVRLAARF